MRPARFWILFSAAYLLTSAVISWYGLFGHWTVSAFGTDYTFNWDPDGFYVAGGITFFDERYLSYLGHPGLTLMFLIQVIARSSYVLSLAWLNRVSFPYFAAKNFGLIVFLTRLAMTVSHLLSCYVLYRVARRFTGRNASLVTSLSYGTTAVVLYYLNRISPEPLMVLFTLLALMACWSYAERGKQPYGLAYVVWAALATVLALYSKVHIVAPLVVFIPCYWMFHGEEGLRSKVVTLGTYFAALSLFAVVLGWKLDVAGFSGYWSEVAGAAPAGSAAPSLGGMARGAVALISQIAPNRGWLPGFDTQRAQFNLAELVFVLASVWGALRYWRAYPDRRRQMLWLAVFLAMITPAALFKLAHHYYLVHFAFAAVFFGYLVDDAVTRYVPERSESRRRVYLVAVPLAVHAMSFALFIDTRTNDARQYMTWWQPYFAALHDVRYGETVGMVGLGDQGDIRTRLGAYYARPTSAFTAAFDSFYVFLPDSPTQESMDAEHVAIVLRRGSDGVHRVPMNDVLEERGPHGAQGPDHRHYRTGRFLSCRAAAGQGL